MIPNMPYDLGPRLSSVLVACSLFSFLDLFPRKDGEQRTGTSPHYRTSSLFTDGTVFKSTLGFSSLAASQHLHFEASVPPTMYWPAVEWMGANPVVPAAEEGAQLDDVSDSLNDFGEE